MQSTNNNEQTTFNFNKETAYALSIFQNKLNGILTQVAVDANQAQHQCNESQLSNFPMRTDIAFTYFEKQLAQIFHWLFTSSESSNFTYSISDTNKDYLANFCAVITGNSFLVMRSYINELASDKYIYDHVAAQIQDQSRLSTPIDTKFDFGRRFGWYAMIRAVKPKVVVETGVEQGLGSLIITSALKKNAQEGFPGYYYGTDINPRAGYLFSGALRDYGEILYGDSIDSLNKLNCKIDIFINDSDHSSEYEMREYRVVEAKLAERALILGDNAHSTNQLCEFAKQTGRKFLFFQEKPLNHWYPGAGIGVAFK